ncbi:hypothetical protein CDO52_17855 [Nocardiopsis gilva YIM 90087]|uniref:Uncharacterized protein n=1 Tax=Nocardiopsis gilva YIM 90087 TaxID=1235441 RepID=A0A223S8G6_9ACTN|nr:hypothetical protein [Nocardiopsis gilva]ASU84415.1 hypothetical protein CDO52_17855 [Nocardiopsis gilva YIM 90087]
MDTQRIRAVLKNAAVVSTGVVVLPAVFSAAASASTAKPAESTQEAPGWKCRTWAGEHNTGAKCWKSESVYVSANYRENVDKFDVIDHFDNDRSTIGYLQAQGSGTAIFTNGTHDLEFTEDNWVRVKVCTSSSPKGVCSPWSAKGST